MEHKKYFYIYMIVCTEGNLKGKYYIGQRLSNIPPEEDNYKGSGVIIKDYYKKYPNSYIKYILQEVNSEEELNIAEFNWVRYSYNIDENCLNCCPGGVVNRENKYWKDKKLSEEHCKNLSKSHKNKIPWNKGKKYKLNLTEESREKYREANKKKKKWNKGIHTGIAPNVNTHRVYENKEHTKWHMEKNN